ncbi:hypothetical protein OC835_007431, partial [Tilletia horrida]
TREKPSLAPSATELALLAALSAEIGRKLVELLAFGTESGPDRESTSLTSFTHVTGSYARKT